MHVLCMYTIIIIYVLENMTVMWYTCKQCCLTIYMSSPEVMVKFKKNLIDIGRIDMIS